MTTRHFDFSFLYFLIRGIFTSWGIKNKKIKIITMYPNSNSGACARDGDVRGADIRRPWGGGKCRVPGGVDVDGRHIPRRRGGRPAGRPRGVASTTPDSPPIRRSVRVRSSESQHCHWVTWVGAVWSGKWSELWTLCSATACSRRDTHTLDRPRKFCCTSFDRRYGSIDR